MRCDGTGLPAAMPVRKFSKPVRGTVPFARSSSSALNMVGTPYRPVARSVRMAVRVARGEKAGVGKRMAEPWVAVAM